VERPAVQVRGRIITPDGSIKTNHALGGEPLMSASNEFWNVALLTAIVIGVALVSRLF
jgi:hypothetical protein